MPLPTPHSDTSRKKQVVTPARKAVEPRTYIVECDSTVVQEAIYPEEETLSSYVGIMCNHEADTVIAEESVPGSTSVTLVPYSSDPEMGLPESMSSEPEAFDHAKKSVDTSQEKEKCSKAADSHQGRNACSTKRAQKRKTNDDETRDLSCQKDNDMCSQVRYLSLSRKKRWSKQSRKDSDNDTVEVAMQQFHRSMEKIYDGADEIGLNPRVTEDNVDITESCISKEELRELRTQSAKLKALQSVNTISADRLMFLLQILEKYIKHGINVSPFVDPNDNEEEMKLWFESAMDRIEMAADACMTALNIMTSPNMPKKVYLEDVIDSCILYAKYQIQQTIYPFFDSAYNVDKEDRAKYEGCSKKEESKKSDKRITYLYNKLCDILNALTEFLHIQGLTDTAVLYLSSLGVSVFFVVDVSELQLAASHLVSTIFKSYENHRKVLLDDILTSITRLPTRKRCLRAYRLNSDENIQMLTALVLQILQGVTSLSEDFVLDLKEKFRGKSVECRDIGVVDLNCQKVILDKYKIAVEAAGIFLFEFLNKCSSRNEEANYKTLFENFVRDLLVVLNKPEWPVANLVVSLLGKLLVYTIASTTSDVSSRSMCLELMGLVTARMRQDIVTTRMDTSNIFFLIQSIRDKEGEGVQSAKSKSQSEAAHTIDEEDVCFLQLSLLNFLAAHNKGNELFASAKSFYIAQWFKEIADEMAECSLNETKSKPVKKKSKKEKENKENTREEKFEQKMIPFLQTMSNSFESTTPSNKRNAEQAFSCYRNAELISRYLGTKSFLQKSDFYLTNVLRLLAENSVSVRSKVMKCLTMITEADPEILGRVDVQLVVKKSFLDPSTAVRESVVDLLGKFVLGDEKLVSQYYDILSGRILDTGLSVRKRVVKILRDICIQYPQFPKVPEACVKMMRRINDEESVQKLVLETFRNMWFTPESSDEPHSTTTLLNKVKTIAVVVIACSGAELHCFEQLILFLFKPNEDVDRTTRQSNQNMNLLSVACKEIVNGFIEYLLQLDEGLLKGAKDDNMKENSDTSRHVLATLSVLLLFAKIKPKMLFDHVATLQPYLSLKCETQIDYQIISTVARILEQVVPLMDSPSEPFLAQLEEDSMKIIMQHDKNVVASCLSCIGSVVNNVTHNYKLIRECFKQYYGRLLEFQTVLQKSAQDEMIERFVPFFRRAVFIVGMLVRHFDFGKKELAEGLPAQIKDMVFETLMYLAQKSNRDMQVYSLKALGNFCVRYSDFMMKPEVQNLYLSFLVGGNQQHQDDCLRFEVLTNMETFLQEEEIKAIKMDKEWAQTSKKEDLKEMDDVSSGMASAVIQLYIKEILQCVFDPSSTMRQAAFRIVQLTVTQGLVHPIHTVPYLVCMSTDVDQNVAQGSEIQLQYIDQKYPGFVYMKAQLGVHFSYNLQKILQSNSVVRGYRTVEKHVALNGFVYSILRRTKQQKRAFVLSILKQFELEKNTALSEMLYLTDNLAYFPYQLQDEPLFVIHQIDIILSLTGTTTLQSFNDDLFLPLPANSKPQDEEEESEDEVEDEELLLKRIPDKPVVISEYISASLRCLLLLYLREHLKASYGITDNKIMDYMASESRKQYDKPVHIRAKGCFNPEIVLSQLTNDSMTPTKESLVQIYLCFKNLMSKFDLDHGDSTNSRTEQEPDDQEDQNYQELNQKEIH